MNDRVSCEIIIIGNEILSGFVKETNSHFLIDYFTNLGGRIERVSCIQDDVTIISNEIRETFKRGAKLIVCSGGLGPTDDDITLEGISKGLSLPLFEDGNALEMVKESYINLFNEGKTQIKELTPEREKMSYLPVGSIPLYNAIGAAPGVLIKHSNKYILSLPGVPAELKYILKNSFKPFVKELFHQKLKKIKKSFFLNIKDESLIANKLKDVRALYKDLYIKSKPGKEKNLFRVEIVIFGVGVKEEVQRKIEEVAKIFNSDTNIIR
ncbi:MAG: molybdopterin-binding protein [Caldisericia bacterium]|nr:molybdopterin-binding protein [Caldisericia bacterium]